MTANKLNELGNIYGDLIVTGLSERRSVSGGVYWICKCVCGASKHVVGYSLRNGHTKSCGCKTYNRPNNPETLYKARFRSLKAGAKDRGFPVQLDYEKFKIMIKEPCWFCGMPPYDVRNTYNRKRYTVGIHADHSEALQGVDRLDSSFGYIEGNCVPCCSMCNRMKSDFTVKEFLSKVQTIYKFKENSNE